MTSYLEKDTGGGGRASAVVKLTAVERVQQRREMIEDEAIARDLALMEELEAFVQSLPKRTEGRSPTPREIREMAYEEREAGILRPEIHQ